MHKDIWVSVNNNFDIVDGGLYKAIKNCLETLQKVIKYNKQNLWSFIESYAKIPKYDQKSPLPDYYMDMYFPAYTGIIEHHEYERWILIKLVFLKQSKYKHNLHMLKKSNYEKPTVASSNKEDDVLRENDLIVYYSLKSDAPPFVDLLFSRCLY